LTTTARIRLKPEREKSLLRRHPWVFSGAAAKVEGKPQPGETLGIISASGEWLGWGVYSPASQIVVRVWSWEENEPPGGSLIARRLKAARELRIAKFGSGTNDLPDGMRLVHGESDGLPGLVVDRYGETLVLQVLSAGAERWRDEIIAALVELYQPRSIFERSDVDVRQLEGLPLRTGLVWGVDPPERIEMVENGLHLRVDVRGGHKTGFYLDQRTARRKIFQHAQGRDVLDCFCYTGGFSLAALAGGAKSVLAMDSSAEALQAARQHVALNGLDEKRVEFWQQDVFQGLRGLRDRGRSFDLIVLDPPKFAATAAQAQRAARGYKDINLLAFKLLRPGGMLATFSCSGGISAELFQKIVAGAALDAGVDARIVDTFQQDADHPVALNFPEGAYLKGLLLWIAEVASNPFSQSNNPIG
jgi:23S rRNA (cytosine1962-C5)-methyltransferase